MARAREDEEDLERKRMVAPDSPKNIDKAAPMREEDESDVVEEENNEIEENEENGSKIQTPEQENTLYEQRFTPKNNRLFEKLVKEWTK
jgi:hypothetical protein